VKYDALSKTTQIFSPNSVWSASNSLIVVSLLKFSSQGRKNDSPVSLTAPKSLIESHAPVTGSDGRSPSGNHV